MTETLGILVTFGTSQGDQITETSRALYMQPKTLKSWAKMSTCNKVNNSFSGRINSKRNESTCSGSGREIPSCRRSSLWTVRTKPDFFPAQDSCTFLTKTSNIWTRPRFATEPSHITWDEFLTSIGTPVEVPCHTSKWSVAFFPPELGRCSYDNEPSRPLHMQS